MRGDFAPGSIPVEFMKSYRLEPSDLLAGLPQERAVFVLRNKGVDSEREGLAREVVQENAPYYRLIVQDAVFRDIGGDVRVLPGAFEEPLFADIDGMPFTEFLGKLND